MYNYLQHFIFLVQTEITDQVTDLLQNETNRITFSCQATGEPIPTISWYFNGAVVNVSDTSKYNVSSSVNGTVVVSLLTITNTQSSDVGTYTCQAGNIIGIDRSSGILTVNGKPASMDYFLLCINNAADAAEMLEPLGIGTNYTEEGGNITLRCVGVGHPPPLIQWRKLNGPLSDRTSNSSMSMSTNEGNITRITEDLILTRAYRDDTGIYECLVSNLLNIVTRSTNLIIQCM